MNKMLKLPPETMRYLTIGAEFIGIFLALVIIGLLLDKHFGYTPLFILLGTITGFAGAMYRLMRTAHDYEQQRIRRSKSTDTGAENDAISSGADEQGKQS